MLVDIQRPESSTGALRSERTRATTFASSNVVEGAVPIYAPAIVERLSSGTDVTIAFRFVGETLGTKERTPLSVDAVAGSHVRSDVAIRQPLQEISVSVCRVGGHRFRLSSLPVFETGQHVLGSDRFLTHACGRGLHTYDHTTVVVHKIVIVVPQP